MKRGFITLGASSSDHPNRHPFSGVLTWLNAASDNPVGGAKGALIYIPADVGIAALDTLVGMGVNIKASLDGHNPRFKIGVIEKAWAGDPDDTGAVPVNVEGYLYASDFPDEVEDLQAEKDDLGFSYEAKAKLEAMEDQPRPTMKATEIVWTGAAILYKKKAAYTNTSLAAEGDESVNEEELKKALEAMGLGDIESMVDMFAQIKKALAEKDVYAWMSMTLSAEAHINELTEKVASLETELAQAKEALTAQAESLKASADATLLGDYVKSDSLEGYVKVEQFNELKASYDETKKALDALQAEADEKAKYERKSVPGVTLLAKYQPIGEVTDLNAEIDKIKADSTLNAVEKTAKIMEAQAKYRQSNA